MRPPPLLLPLALAFALAASAEERPRFYTWTDAEGVVHYTNDPSLVPGSAPAPAPPPAAEPAPPLPADGATPAVEAGAAPAVAVPTGPGLELEEVMPEDSPDEVRLKQLIAEDRERIKQLLTEPDVDGPTLAASPGLGEIAARLARHQAELEALRQERTP